MTRKGYINLGIPETLVKEIDEIVEKKEKGYTSRAEFVKDAVRQLLKTIKP